MSEFRRGLDAMQGYPIFSMRVIIKFVLIVSVCWFAASVARAAELRVPAHVTAGNDLSIQSAGSGDATFYLVGPGTAIKKNVRLGRPITVAAKDLRNAGRYVAIIRGDGDAGKTFFVVPGDAAEVAFLARPSRVPASRKGAVSGTAFVFDRNHNLMLAPTPVKFELSIGGRSETRTASTSDGVAYQIFDSRRQAGAAQFVASVGDTQVRRVVQQTASDPCNLRLRAQPSKNGILVETDPIRDCAGNAVPDGTIVTFTELDASGRSTIDARIKKGVARAELPNSPNATLSVAAGVAMGNEIHWSGRQ